MSGSTIGGVVGGVIGFWVGGPQGAQWGWMIGSAVGGAVAPEHIRAPSIGDAQQQTSQAGIPIPVIFGKPGRMKCNIIDGEAKARKIIVEEQQGKGGPVVESERFLLTSAFGICEGPIAGIQRILRNGEIIYDRTTDGEWQGKYPGSDFDLLLEIALKRRAKTSLWQQKIRVYLGSETQLPDPALEAIHGVGNTPYYRGLAYMVVEDDDVTQGQGRANIWEVEPVAVGVEADTGGGTELAVQGYSQFNNAHWPLATGESDYTLDGFRYINAGDTETFSAATIQEIIDHFAGLGFMDVIRPPSVYLGYSAATGTEPDTFKVNTVAQQPDITDNESVILVYNDYRPVHYADLSFTGTTSCPYIMLDETSWTMGDEGQIAQRVPDSTAEAGALHVTCTGDETGSYLRVIKPLYIKATRKRITPVQDAVPIPDADGWGVDSDGALVKLQEMTAASGTYKVLTIQSIATVDSRSQYVYYEQGPVLELGDPDYNSSTFWTAARDAAVAAGTLPSSASAWTYGVEFPDVVSSVYEAVTPPFTTLEATDVTLQSVVEALCVRATLPAARLDADALATDIIPGYLVATGGSVADALRPTQAVFTYDTPEIDNQVVAVKRGGAIAVAITDDDLLEQTDEDATTTPQPVEYPRKLHLIVPDPDANYTPTPQTFERYTPDVRAVGEQRVAVPIPFDADETKSRVEVMGKVAWARAEGTIELPLPEYFSQFTPSDCFTYADKRWLIEEATYADGEVRWKAVYDRVSNYSFTGTGAAANPSLPDGTLLGPTQVEIINVSPLRDADDASGFYVGLRGYFDSWSGCTIQTSADEGVTWANGPTTSRQCTIGELVTDLADGLPYTFHPDATVTVQVRGELASCTYDEILAEANAAIIGDEIIQFQTVTDNGDGEYVLTGLTRGRNNTAHAAHYVGDRFVLLNNVVFVPQSAADIGKEISVRAVTTGTDADSAETHTFDWLPAYAQTEWVPVAFRGLRDTSNNLTVTFAGRGRLGTTAAPLHSQYFDGYRITFTKGGVRKSYITTNNVYSYSAAQQTIDFGSATGTMRVDVEAMNRITGPSPFLTGSIT